ncbi:hypothetical protein ABE427_01880 [Acinetobacter higginsii]|uniref:hypothetical protein n=1 Tax=Acinetobacter higginsii TaxID=70347 RepID=UPI00320B2D77
MLVEAALDKLCNNLRMHCENMLNFHKLKLVDPEEAITNLDRSFESILEAFHTLYDVSKREIDYFEKAETAFLIMVRNAIHHRNHTLFNSWNAEMHLNGGMQKYAGAKFLLCDYQPLDCNSHIAKYYYCLEDVYERLDGKRASEYLDTFLKENKRNEQLSLFKDELSFNEIEIYARSERYPLKQVYINVMPILNCALKYTFEKLYELGIKAKGYDANVYFKLFRVDCFFDLKKVIYEPISLNF